MTRVRNEGTGMQTQEWGHRNADTGMRVPECSRGYEGTSPTWHGAGCKRTVYRTPSVHSPWSSPNSSFTEFHSFTTTTPCYIYNDVCRKDRYLANKYCLLVGNIAFFSKSFDVFPRNCQNPSTEICKPKHRIILTVQQPLNAPHNPQTETGSPWAGPLEFSNAFLKYVHLQKSANRNTYTS